MGIVLAPLEITRMKIFITLDYNRDMTEDEVADLIGEILAQCEEDQQGQDRNLHDFRFTVNDDNEEIVITNDK